MDFLIHVTDTDPRKWDTKSILASKNLDSRDQFPGSYFSLVTTYNTNEEIGGNYDPNYVLIFSGELLKQKNYHFNIRDYNGFITEKLTFFPWNIDEGKKLLKKKDYGLRNEIVFHDDVSFNYLLEIVEFKLFSFKTYEKIVPRPVPQPNLTLLPFYAFCFERYYSGRDPIAESNYVFFVKMAKLCKLKTIPKTSAEIVDEIEKVYKYYYINRSEQNILALRDTELKGGMCERQTTKKYTDRPSPPYRANECQGEIKEGNDGGLNISSGNATGVYRWVKYNGSPNRGGGGKSPAKRAKSPKRSPAKGECREDQVMNPETGRCVLRSGAIGKKILAGVKRRW